jgi:glycyl-tRNA synthetase
VLPLTKKQAERAERVHKELTSHFFADYDVSGNIGKRYRRQDEIGTPFCITVDFDTEADDTVTVRDRDSMGQIRLPIRGLREYIEEKMRF